MCYKDMYYIGSVVKGSGDRYLNHLYTIEKTERIRYLSVCHEVHI